MSLDCRQSTSDTYPATLRVALTFQRRLGTPFDIAWRNVTERIPAPDGWGESHGKDNTLHNFLKRHFRAAYNRDSSMRGRFLPSAPDASRAVRLLPRQFEKPAPDTCRSGDGCSKPAVVGRFGPMFCEGHGRELAAMIMVPYEGLTSV